MRPTLLRISSAVGVGAGTVGEYLRLLKHQFGVVGLYPTDKQVLVIYLRERIQENIQRDKRRGITAAHHRKPLPQLSEGMSDEVIFGTLKLGAYSEEPFTHLRPTHKERREYPRIQEDQAKKLRPTTPRY